MPLLTAAIAAGGFFTLPLAGNGALAAIMDQPMRLEIAYEGIEPVPVLGRVRTATATLTADLSPQSYKIVAKTKADGMMDWFMDYNLTLISTGMMTKLGLKPARYDSLNKDGHKDRHVVVDYTPGMITAIAQPAWRDFGFPPATLQQKLEARDPLSAFVQLALRMDTTPDAPCGGPLRIFDGRQRYDLQLKFAQRFTWKSKAYSGPAIKCDVEFIEVAGFGPKSAKQSAKAKADIEWANLILAEMDGGTFTPPIKFEARSKKRGKITIQATKLSYGPAE